MNALKLLSVALIIGSIGQNTLNANEIRVGYACKASTQPATPKDIRVGSIVVAPLNGKFVAGIVMYKNNDRTYNITFKHPSFDKMLDNMINDECTPIFEDWSLNVPLQDIKSIPFLTLGQESKPFALLETPAFNDGDIVSFEGKVGIVKIVDYDTYHVLSTPSDVQTFSRIEHDGITHKSIRLISAN